MSEHKPKIKFVTVGCKVNQYETQAIRESFQILGVTESREGNEPCDFVLVNTCTVTADADKTNRYWIRRLRREHPQARIAVTGCYVQKNRRDLEAMKEVDFVFSNEEKSEIASRLLQKTDPALLSLPLQVSRSEGRARAYLKIQDGCNHACSFCKVVLVRGRSRSRALCEIKDETVRLRDAGYREIVLTGIQLGAYGLDFESSTRLAHPRKRDHYHLLDVIKVCSDIPGIERIRLSSIEPMDIGEPLILAFRDFPKLCPHLHIPLQSGDDEILRKMNRRYTAEDYRCLVLKLRQDIPMFSLTLDVMAGFPGETEEQFERTVRLLRQLKPLKSHVFPYSRREGTRAALYPNLPALVVKRRVQHLLDISQSLGEESRKTYLGQCLDVLVESRQHKGGSFFEGTTANYLKVVFESETDVREQIVPVRLDRIDQDGFWGSIQKNNSN